jgi:hypothetical protein
MHLQIFVIIIFILIIFYLYNKQKKIVENLDATQGFNKEALINLLSSYNSIQIPTNNVSNNIQDSLKLNGNILMNNITSNSINTPILNATNIQSDAINISNIDMTKYKICLQDQSHCIKPYLLKLYSQINLPNSPFNNMYLSDASNCVIYEYAPFNDEPYDTLPVSLIIKFGTGYNILTDSTLSTIRYSTIPSILVSRPALYYNPQQDFDISGGFKIVIPNPATIKFKCKVVWIEIKSNLRCSFRVTSSIPDISSNVLDVVYSNYLTYSNSLRPDGADYNIQTDRPITITTQWIPIPINYDALPNEKTIYIRRNRTDNNVTSRLMICGLAFTTNPWNHCKLPALCIYWELNEGNFNINKLNPATTYIDATTTTLYDKPSFNEFTDYITFHRKLLITRIPVINSGKDKILYLNVANNTSNINLQNVLIQTNANIPLGTDITTAINIIDYSYDFANKTITEIDNFSTTYDNPFATYFNSHATNRYIATVIPAALIKSDFIRVILQSQPQAQSSTGTGLMIREIGTHDLLYSE